MTDFDLDDYEYQQMRYLDFPENQDQEENRQERYQNVIVECQNGVRFVWSLDQHVDEASLIAYYRRIYKKYGVEAVRVTYSEYAEEDVQKVEGTVKDGRWRPPGFSWQPSTKPGGKSNV